jgi:hypothetical protein
MDGPEQGRNLPILRVGHGYDGRIGGKKLKFQRPPSADMRFLSDIFGTFAAAAIPPWHNGGGWEPAKRISDK